MIAFVGLTWALLLVRFCGGDLRRLGRYNVPLQSWILFSFVVQGLARGRLPWTTEWREVSLALWAIVSLGLIVLLCLAIRLFAARLMALGIGLNLFVVLVNGGMPVAAHEATVIRTAPGFYHLAHRGDAVVFMADVLPAPFGYVVSIGDMLLMVGMVVLVLEVSTGIGRDAAAE